MTTSPWVKDLVSMWRRLAAKRKELWPRDPAVPILLALASEVEHTAEAYGTTGLTIAEAARESGYSAAHLRELACQGVLPLIEETGPMRVRRTHLPRKPGLGVENDNLSPAARELADRIAAGRRK